MATVEEEIVEVENELSQLTQKLEDLQHRNTRLKEWKSTHLTAAPEDVLRVLQESLNSKIDVVKQFSPFNFTKVVSNVVHQDAENIESKQCIQGYCGDVHFQIDLQISEPLMSEGFGYVSHMSVSASEQFSLEFEDTIERLVADKNVQGCLRLIQQYSFWHSARTKTFQHFTAKHPDIVQIIDEGKAMEIMHGKCKMIVHWKRYNIGPDNKLDPDLSLELVFPKQSKEVKSLKETVPEKFELMIKELGLEQTLNSLINLNTL